VGTTKLTRKEILAEDPVHVALMELIEFFKVQGKNVAIGVAAAVVVAAAIYLGMQYLQSRDTQAQQEFGKALDFFHAQVDPGAQDDPYAKGSNPVFKSDTAKYQAAVKEFSSLSSRYGFSKLAVLARYYQGLCQLELGQKDDSVKSLEAVRNNTKDRTTGYLARKVLARIYLKSGNPKGAQEVLESMVADPQCQLPQEDIKIQLAQVYAAEGKRDQAIKVLREARDQAQLSRSMLGAQISKELQQLEALGPAAPIQQTPVQSPPATPPR
jgi:predicted negative regulator of RcsB-dependent stress response